MKPAGNAYAIIERYITGNSEWNTDSEYDSMGPVVNEDQLECAHKMVTLFGRLYPHDKLLLNKLNGMLQLRRIEIYNMHPVEPQVWYAKSFFNQQ